MIEWLDIGYIAKAHGLKGELKAKLNVYDIYEYAERKSFHLAKRGTENRSVHKITYFKVHKPTEAIIRLKGVGTRDAAEAMVGYTIWIQTSDLPELEEGRFYYFEVTGFEIEDKNLGRLGTIVRILDMPAQDIIVMNYQDKEVLIPMTDEFVFQADKEKRLIYTCLPEGLLELYL